MTKARCLVILQCYTVWILAEASVTRGMPIAVYTYITCSTKLCNHSAVTNLAWPDLYFTYAWVRETSCNGFSIQLPLESSKKTAYLSARIYLVAGYRMSIGMELLFARCRLKGC